MLSAPYQLIRLANGTHSVHSVAERETFHPVIGPRAEARALYLDQLHLCDRLARHAGEFVIWDVGLGAAANPLTVLEGTREIACPIRLISFDQTLEPLRFALAHATDLGYLVGWEPFLQALLQEGRVTIQQPGRVIQWEVRTGDFPAFLARPEETAATNRVPAPHVILFDAYSPAKNPAMWTLDLFTRLHRHLDPARPCLMPTYSRSTLLRVSLLLAGFFVGTGRATGLKEETTIAASHRDLLDHPLTQDWLRRVRNSTSAEPLHEAVYRQARLTPATLEKLLQHPQFQA